MKTVVFAIIFLMPCFGMSSQATFVISDSMAVESHSIRLIAHVKDMDQDYVLIEVEEVVSYTTGIYITPASGDEILVRLPGREIPKKESRIEIDLQEKIDVGAMPTGYIMTSFRTIE